MVLIITDRLQLDRQLGDTVETMLAAHGIDLMRCTSSTELHNALKSVQGDLPRLQRPRAVLSTLQKFAGLAKSHSCPAAGAPAGDAKGAARALDVLLGGAAGAGRARIALIADEAHRSHGGGTSLAINSLLGGRVGQSPRLTYIGFSATPSQAALRLFGVNRRGATGPEFAPAHCYSMADAIRDGYVCNILEQYTCVKPWFRLSAAGAAATEAPRLAGAKGRTCAQGECDEPQKHGGRGNSSRTSDRRVIHYKASFIASHFARMLAAEHAQGARGGKGRTGSEGSAGRGESDGGKGGVGGAEGVHFKPRGMIVCR